MHQERPARHLERQGPSEDAVRQERMGEPQEPKADVERPWAQSPQAEHPEDAVPEASAWKAEER